MVATLTWNDRVLASDTSHIRPDHATGQPTLFPSAQLIARYIRAIPEGERRDIDTMRRELAARHGVLTTCPETTRRHLLAIAEATFDAFDDGALLRELTPVWRVLDERAGKLLDALSFEPAFLFDLRASEWTHSPEIASRAA